MTELIIQSIQKCHTKITLRRMLVQFISFFFGIGLII